MTEASFWTDDRCHCLVADMPAAKRRKTSPVPCCDPACLDKACYEKDCKSAFNFVCPDDCVDAATTTTSTSTSTAPSTATTTPNCIDACPDTCNEPAICLDACPDACNACPDDICTDSCSQAICDLHSCLDTCQDYCHTAHTDNCLPSCHLTACTDPCLDYDCQVAMTGFFDQHSCNYWANDPAFDMSSLSASPYGDSYSTTPHSLGQTTYDTTPMTYNQPFPVQMQLPMQIPAVQDFVTQDNLLPTATKVKTERVSVSSSSTPPANGKHVCLWAGCTESPFSSTEDLHNHVKAAHSAKTPSGFVCMWSGCETHRPDGTANAPYSAATKNHFHRHMQRHTGYAPHKCPTCVRSFKTPQQLSNHLKTHTGEKPFQCAYCSKSFALLDPLRIHERVHKNEKRFECPICGDRAVDSSNMSAHRRDIHGVNGLPCPHPGCTYRDSRAERLKAHMREAGHVGSGQAVGVKRAVAADVARGGD